MRYSNRNIIRGLLIGLLAVGGFVSVASSDGPVEVRRVPVLDADKAKSPKSIPVAKPAAVASKKIDRTSVPEFDQRHEVKKAGVANSGNSNVRASAAELAIRKREAEKARTMKPKVKAEPKRTGNESWTERYELGPGDSLNFGLFGNAKLDKLKVPVAPDWTISYLDAQQISVRGLTVEELRIRMTEKLSEKRRNVKLKVWPAALASKKYTVLGKVKDNNVYPLDRPTRLLEAIARAKGIVVGSRGQSATELADLKRSFIVRKGKKLSVDFESLYRTGAMEHNVFIEPGDYIYIASNVHNETYVFGSVGRPGVVPLTGTMTVMGAIAESGGYSKHAWRGRVLLVRGSVGNPEPVVVNTREILNGNQKDIALEPGDIVYVHKQPWSYARDVLDIAIKSYIQAATAVAIQEENSVSIGL